MRHLLGTFALLLALAGCGDDSSEGSPPTETHPVVLVSGTGGGGEVATHATDVTDAAALASYVEQFEASFGKSVTAAADKVDLAGGQALIAQVVAVGCDVPPGAAASTTAIVPDEIASPKQECFAAVTTVGLAAVPG